MDECFTRNSSDCCWKLSSKVQTELYDRNQTSMDILDNEENWDYTHRMAGKWWIIGGVLTILLGFQKFVDPIGAAVGIILIVTLIPAIASYIYYKKHRVM